MATCDLCQDPTCPCGAVVMRTDAELIDALRACRWILAEKVKAAKAERAQEAERKLALMSHECGLLRQDSIGHYTRAKAAEAKLTRLNDYARYLLSSNNGGIMGAGQEIVAIFNEKENGNG